MARARLERAAPLDMLQVQSLHRHRKYNCCECNARGRKWLLPTRVNTTGCCRSPEWKWRLLHASGHSWLLPSVAARGNGTACCQRARVQVAVPCERWLPERLGASGCCRRLRLRARGMGALTSRKLPIDFTIIVINAP